MDRGKLTSDQGFGEPSTTAPDRITMVESPRPDESADCCPECGGYVFNPEVNPGGASTITTASPTAQYCTLCGFTGHPSVFADHSCLAYRAAEILDEPNRFDPFEALDTINRAIPGTRCGDEVRSTVHALRAYITGMER